MLLEGDVYPITAGVNLKIPPFWSADPQVWFTQVKAQFSTQGITAQKTKFNHIVATLLPEFAQEVYDFILSPQPQIQMTNLRCLFIWMTFLKLLLLLLLDYSNSSVIGTRTREAEWAIAHSYVKQVGLSPPHGLKAQFSLKTHIISNLPIKNKSDIRGKKPSDIDLQLLKSTMMLPSPIYNYTSENEVSHVNFG